MHYWTTETRKKYVKITPIKPCEISFFYWNVLYLPGSRIRFRIHFDFARIRIRLHPCGPGIRIPGVSIQNTACDHKFNVYPISVSLQKLKKNNDNQFITGFYIIFANCKLKCQFYKKFDLHKLWCRKRIFSPRSLLGQRLVLTLKRDALNTRSQVVWPILQFSSRKFTCWMP